MKYILKRISNFITTLVMLIMVIIVGLYFWSVNDSQKSKAAFDETKITYNYYETEEYDMEQINLVKKAAEENRRKAFLEEQVKIEAEKVKADAEKVQASVEEKVKQYLGNNISKVGIGYYDVETGKGFSINGDKYFTAASTVKVQMNMVLFDMIKEGKLNIDETIKYLQSDYEGGTGILQGEDKSKPIALQKLSDYSIMYSDNIATNMIIRKIGYAQMKNRFSEKVEHQVPQNDNLVTPNEGLAFLKMLYENKNNNIYYPRLIGIMKTTVFHDRLDKYVPQNIVAHKVGDYGAFVNDVGIVYSNKPYIIAVYTQGLPNANETIANINKIIYGYHK
ncbi:serine hydrolase [Clostridium sp. YIM B02515]|uniref:Serine hydrolase n=1 Tax=Clostridium rhizosphaerae TaxID=2803861 RepID=A0ABS1T7Q3_9CLOT|nr:serine hydrolase [Clostridium rhizosphaerae]MBL4935369.1 serine hydrolase [Clostridium rhizosphaerae]